MTKTLTIDYVTIDTARIIWLVRDGLTINADQMLLTSNN